MKTLLNEEQKKFAIRALRRASMKWTPRSDALKKARVSRGIYRCNICNDLTGRLGGNLDHIEPVIDPVKGFINLDVYAARLMTYDGWQWLCKVCHAEKTLEENKLRAKEQPDYFTSRLKRKKTTTSVTKKKAKKKTKAGARKKARKGKK